MTEILKLNKYEHLKTILKDNDVVLLSGASTSGKSFIADKICQEDSNVTKLKSTTTRAKRNANDNDYNFVTLGEFKQLKHIKAIEFPAGSNNWYSYTKEELYDKLSQHNKIIIIVAPETIKFYKEFLENKQIKFKSIYRYVDQIEMTKRYLDRVGCNNLSELPQKITEASRGSLEDLEKRISQGQDDVVYFKYYDYVIDASEKINFDIKK